MCSFRKYPESPTEGIGISWEVVGSLSLRIQTAGNRKYICIRKLGFSETKWFIKCMKINNKMYQDNWNFQRCVGVLEEKKSLLWGRYGYFGNHTMWNPTSRKKINNNNTVIIVIIIINNLILLICPEVKDYRTIIYWKPSPNNYLSYRII